MGQDSAIEWCDHTFSPWWGCVKISSGCTNCYADDLANRFQHDVFGANKPRRFFGEKHWNEPLRWNKQKWIECEDCKYRGSKKKWKFETFKNNPNIFLSCPKCKSVKWKNARPRIFCGSMCDVFEIKKGLTKWRVKLGDLILSTPNLDWLILSKRELSQRIANDLLWINPDNNSWQIPDNVWLGTSVENQEQANKRIPELLKIPAKVRFLSCEPLLGPIDLRKYLHQGITWCIIGSESGHNRRPMKEKWVSTIVNDCRKEKIPVFYKQKYIGNKKISCPTLNGKQLTEFPLIIN